jgi:hypothetical protein
MLSPVFSTFSPVRFCFPSYTAPFDTLYLLVIAFAFLIKNSSPTHVSVTEALKTDKIMVARSKTGHGRACSESTF